MATVEQLLSDDTHKHLARKYLEERRKRSEARYERILKAPLPPPSCSADGCRTPIGEPVVGIGGGVYLCYECIDLCAEIVKETREAQSNLARVRRFVAALDATADDRNPDSAA